MIDLHDDLAAALGDRYAVERELGHGGMAIVYLARDVKHARRVAVKVLRPELASSIGGERFLREIAVAARLVHPNILTLHDSGSADGLLYYVMPFIEGETLRARLDREHQLPIEDALAITRQVAAALDYAHAQGVVHRDIKPENILLTGDHVSVADFGLARALYTASSQRLTESAVAVGTPAYMSPEQAAADPEVDRRADVYALACVLYEMVVGTPPFRGATAQAVLAQHLTAPPPSICAQRPHCPGAVDAAVQRAMEKVPADRFKSAGEFVRAMEETPHSAPTVSLPAPATVVASRRGRRLAAIAGAGVAVAALVVGGVALRQRLAAAGGADGSPRFVVMPFAGADSGAASRTLRRRVSEALDEWDGIPVVDERRTEDALAASEGPRVTTDRAIALARDLGAGRAILGDLTALGDSVRVGATLYDTRDGRVLRLKRVTIRAGAEPTTQQIRALVNGLLRDRDELPWTGATAPEHASLPAWLTYDSARVALDRWDLAAGAELLRRAIAIDPDFPQAQLWLARVQLWSGQLDGWRVAARRAYDLRGALSTYDSLGAEAQLALASERYPEACALFARMTAADSAAVTGWYGLGECQSRDQAVLPDPRSPSGYRFRGSMERAARAYMRILEDGTPPQPAFVYQRLSWVLFTAGNRLRTGHLLGDTTTFAAVPTLDHDTLAFVPYPFAEFMAGTRGISTRGKAAAIERNRATLRRLYVDWTRSAPTSPEAHAALATLLEATEQLTSGGRGGPSAVEQIHEARRLTSERAKQLTLARTELRLRVKRGEWDAAAALVDSLFARTRGAEDSVLIGAAALTGRLQPLAGILRANAAAAPAADDADAHDAPPSLQRDAAEMLAYAALGVCSDALLEMPRRIDRQLGSYVADPSRRQALRAALLRRPYSLAAPCLDARSIRAVDAAGDDVLRMEQALSAGRRDSVRALYARVAAQRGGERPGDVSPEYTYLESWLLAAAGDTAGAIAHLDGSLEALPTLGGYFMDFASQSAGLARAMVLRADLAAALGDGATAARWGGAVATLWAHADPELQPTVQRMRRLAAAGH